MRILDPEDLSQHIDRLYRAAWALCGSREDAEDLVQETFARVLSRPRLLRGDDELYYLMRVLRNSFLTSRRTASRRPVTVATLEDVVTADPKPMARPDQALEVRRCMRRSPSSPRTSARRSWRSTCSGCPIAKPRARSAYARRRSRRGCSEPANRSPVGSRPSARRARRRMSRQTPAIATLDGHPSQPREGNKRGPAESYAVGKLDDPKTPPQRGRAG